MYARGVLSAVLLLGLVTSPASLTVERATGRVAVWHDGEITVVTADLRRTVATLPAPPGSVELLDFAGGVVTYAFVLPEDGSPARAAVGVEDGLERLIWPNRGIGERFPTVNARLTVDGQGLHEFLPLEARLRAELGLSEEIPDGAGTVVIYRFADERVWAIASADFVGAVALSPGDALVVTRDGGLLRYRSPDGVVWQSAGEGQRRVIADVDPRGELAVLVGEHAVEVVEVSSGERRGVWQCSGVVAAKALADGRLLAGTQDGEVWVVTLASTGATAVRLAQLADGEWRDGVALCSSPAGPLACLHPVPGGVVVSAGSGGRLLPLSVSAGRGGVAIQDRPLGKGPGVFW